MDPLSQLLMSLESADKEPDPGASMLPGLRLAASLAASEETSLSREGLQNSDVRPRSSEETRNAKICSYWYHGHCTKSDADCRFLHHIEAARNVLSWQLERKHGPPCGLDLCRYKDAREPKSEPQAIQDGLQGGSESSKRKRRDSLTEDSASAVEQVPTKRRSLPRHWDTPFAVKRQSIDYDDVDISPSGDETSQTCFFWYHGSCSRERDALRGMGPPCEYVHELTDPPSMVPPPPGYIHAEPCDREWCPGDAKTHQKPEHFPRKGIDASLSSSSSSHDGDDETCFFWYHGHCARSSDPRNRQGCSYKHALTDPPSMVQPPPGYVHREPCNRDWCPGDARS